MSNGTITRKFGIEIEAFGVPMTVVADALRAAGIAASVESYNHSTRPHWKLVTDASLTGPHAFELVSPVLEGEEGIAQVRKVGEVLTALGAQVNASCGLHVHVDARDLNVAQVGNVVKAAYQYQPAFDKLVPASRRGNVYCKSLRRTLGQDAAAAFKRINECKTIVALRDALNCDRYHTLNLESLARHGTVEFRQHGGTVEADKMEHWVRLVVGLVVGVAAYKSIRQDKVDGSLDNLLAYAPAKTRRFMRARAAHFGFAA